jgi:hypothetical protein
MIGRADAPHLLRTVGDLGPDRDNCRPSTLQAAQDRVLAALFRRPVRTSHRVGPSHNDGCLEPSNRAASWGRHDVLDNGPAVFGDRIEPDPTEQVPAVIITEPEAGQAVIEFREHAGEPGGVLGLRDQLGGAALSLSSR